MTQQDAERWRNAAHAMQSGVAFEMQMGMRSATEPKHLRAGVNTALVDQGALVKLLVDKGIITEDEYHAAIADAMEAEVKAYEERATAFVGQPVSFA